MLMALLSTSNYVALVTVYCSDH